MTTREEMAEACLRVGVASSGISGWSEPLVLAASQLKRDGELRFRLANLCANTRAIGPPKAAALAAHVEALLKEFP